MKTSTIRRLFLGGALFSAFLFTMIALGRPALAVDTSGYSYGFDLNNSFQYKPHNASGLDTAISSNFTTSPSPPAPTAHAQSWAYAKLDSNTNILTKITGGYGWVDGINPSEYFVWSAFASGTELIVEGAPLGTLVNLRFVVPGTGNDPDDQRPNFPQRPPALADPPVQALFSNSTTDPNVPVPFFDVKVSLVASVVQSGASTNLFVGDATLTSAGVLVRNGDFNQLDFRIDPREPTGFSFVDGLAIPVQVEAGVPFDLMMDLRMSMGDPDAVIDPMTQPTGEQIFTQYEGFNFVMQPPANLARGGGSFVVQLGLDPNNNPAGITLSAVPEPGTLGLALVGLIALAGFARRRRRSRC